MNIDCPKCGSNWQGGPIPKHQQHLFDDTHFSRAIGLEVPEIYDGVFWYKCPDCRSIFHRDKL